METGSNYIFSESVWEEEYIAFTFSNIYTSLSFDPCTTFDLEYLTNAATSGPDKFFSDYSHICLQEYTKSPLLEFVQGYIGYMS